jgi:acetylornithine deacetylase/succinyl-diaminopimelate desuccinylase-like protein
VTTPELLDRILVPRPNGSEALERVASFLADTLEGQGAAVARHGFTATPHGFQLVWLTALALMLGWALALRVRRHGLALALALTAPALLLAEFELLRSPVSGLLPARESNVVGTFAGAKEGPILVFCAHYDTTTHFGDHFDWGPGAGAWARPRGPPWPWAWPACGGAGAGGVFPSGSRGPRWPRCCCPSPP